jgi:hypothetical protein
MMAMDETDAGRVLKRDLKSIVSDDLMWLGHEIIKKMIYSNISFNHR